jgi:crossover junction endodeoxyribonuclease RuvC
VSRYLIGVDPGFSGAVAILWPEAMRLEVHDMPTVPGPKGKTVIACRQLFDLLAPEGEPGVAWLELVGSRPGQGVSSMFRFGQGFGSVEMGVAAQGHVARYVTPAQWKKHFGLTGDKGASRGLAMQRFPAAAHLFARVKDDGRAEAALIALYGHEVGK